MWRPTIDGYESRAESDLRHALVNAVRDGAAQIIESGQVSVVDVVAELDSHERPVFRRLTLYLLARYPDNARDLIAARLTDPTLISDSDAEREYLTLAHRAATGLDSTARRRLLTLIDTGPAPTGRQVTTPSDAVDDVPESLARERLASWQRDRLAAVQPILLPEWDARYQALAAEFGEAPDPTVPMPEPDGVFLADGPVSAGELAAMSTENLAEFLRNWRPPVNDWRGLTPASLRGALSSAVQGDAERRSADTASFIGLPAEYVGAVLNGLWQAATNGAALDWDQVTHLCAWIDEQAVVELAADPTGASARQWREPRLDMLRLLIAELNPEPNPISPDNDAAIWSIIERCCTDPDPTPQMEAGRPSTEQEFMSLALNTVRPQAVRAAISYALRVRRRSRDTDVSVVLSLLDRHVDHHRDVSRAVRSIYGELFPNLVWLDADWASGHTAAIFPLGSGNAAIFDTAWDAYLGGGRLTDAAWALLSEQYAAAVARMDQATPNPGDAARAGQLGGHLLNRYWFGHLNLDDYGRLLREFYAAASPEVTRQIMLTIGTSLDTAEPVDAALIARLVSLWEFRIDAVRNGSDRRELAEFGRWFASGRFDQEWSLRQFLATLSVGGRIEAEGPVLARLAKLAPTRTQACLTFLYSWVSQQPKPWRLTQSLDDIRLILAAGLAGDTTAIHTATKIISLLLRDQGTDLRHLLRNEPPT